MTDYPESFANYPQSTTERRADKARAARLQQPRDALIAALRAVDSGEFAATSVLVCLCKEDEKSVDATYFATARDLYQAVGLLEDVKMLLLKPKD